MFRVSISAMPSTNWKYSSILVDDEALDLVGTHAHVTEKDVDLGSVQRGEDVRAHPVEGQHAAASSTYTTSIGVVIGCRIAKTVGFMGKIPGVALAIVVPSAAAQHRLRPISALGIGPLPARPSLGSG